jgi:hypothetical protein
MCPVVHASSTAIFLVMGVPTGHCKQLDSPPEWSSDRQVFWWVEERYMDREITWM